MRRRNPTGAAPARTGPLWISALLLLTTGCPDAENQKPAQKQRSRPWVKTTRVAVQTLTEQLELTGSIEPTRVARMASPVEGPVIACPVREGDRVRAGQLLARLGRAKGDDAAAASAMAELEREELELGRIEKLVASGALPGEQLDRARVKVSEARARHARAMERLGDYRVSAPWAGVVSRVPVAVGDFVAAREPLVELFDPSSLVLRFAVPEHSATRVEKDAPIEVTLDAHPGRTLTARVSRIFPGIDRRTHTRTVEALVEDPVALSPGMFARLKLALVEVPGALTVPVESVVRRGGKPVVFVIAAGHTARQRTVELGLEADGRVQILAGVEGDEIVAVAGHNRLGDGAPVRVAGPPGKRDAGSPPDPPPGRGPTR